MLHIIGLGRALGARDHRPERVHVEFPEPESARADAADGVQLLLAAGARCPGTPALFAPEFQIYPPALAIQRANFIYGILAGWYSSSFAVDLTPYHERCRQRRRRW